jgi:hypothetical protein
LKSAPLARTRPRCDIEGMPSRASKTGVKRDFVQVARSVVEQAIGEHLDGTPLPTEPPDTRNAAAVALSKLGASKGGKARAEKLSARKRSEIAKRAARVRWSKKR